MIAEELGGLKLPSEALQSFTPPDVDSGTAAIARFQIRYGVTFGGISMLIPQYTASEIVLEPTITKIPNSPACFPGVCNIRGNIVPVYDLFVAFNLEKQEVKGRRVLVLGTGESAIGLVVDGLPVAVKILEHSAPVKDSQSLPSLLQKYIAGGFVIDDTNWYESRFTEIIGALSGRAV